MPAALQEDYLDALRDELRELGWKEGRNLTIYLAGDRKDMQGGDNHADRESIFQKIEAFDLLIQNQRSRYKGVHMIVDSLFIFDREGGIAARWVVAWPQPIGWPMSRREGCGLDETDVFSPLAGSCAWDSWELSRIT